MFSIQASDTGKMLLHVKNLKEHQSSIITDQLKWNEI